MTSTIALLAHDNHKDGLVVLVQQHLPVFARYRLVTTEALGQYLRNVTGLAVETVVDTALGGDIQMAARIVTGEVAAVFCLVDFTLSPSAGPDVLVLLRLCQIHDVPIATNLSTAEAIVTHLAQTRLAYLIFNPIAGQGDSQQELELIRDLLEPHLNLQVRLTTPDLTAEELAQQAVAANADLVIASGGDGTVSAVAGALIGTGVPLGVIPRGTANAFCLAVGIPAAIAPIRRACQVVLTGKPRQIDAARCNGLPMVLLAGVGYEAGMVNRASRDMKDRWGPLAYFIAGWQQLDDQEVFEASLEVDGIAYPFRAAAITVANAAPPTSVLAQGAGTVIFDDGLLDVTIAIADSPAQPLGRKLQALRDMVQLMGSALINADPAMENLLHFRAAQLTISTTPPQKVVIDGEVVELSTLEVESVPGGLTVIVPTL